MRRVRVSGGYSGDVEVTVTDRKAQDLSSAEFKVGLIGVDGDIPAATSPAWQTPAAVDYPKAGQAVLTVRPTAATGSGRFYPHVLVIDSGRAPELVRADDYVELT